MNLEIDADAVCAELMWLISHECFVHHRPFSTNFPALYAIYLQIATKERRNIAKRVK